MPSHSVSRLTAILLAATLLIPCLQSLPGFGADYGSLSGTVSDSQGDPLMGATVLVMGPMLVSPGSVGGTVERVITDARGKFAVAHLVPGWYSVKVTSPTRVPVLRGGIRVDAGTASNHKFVLNDIFAPMRFQLPKHSVSSWGDDWVWVLRTSATTRPIFRYQQEVAQIAPKVPRLPLSASRRLIGMTPGSARRDPLGRDPGLGSVLAYLRPLSEDSDLLVAGLMTANGIQASSIATALRRNMIKGNPQELTLVVHQLSFSDGVPLPSGSAQDALSHARGLAVSYTQTRRLFPNATVTAGMEINYLDAARDAMTVQPRLKMEYQVGRATLVAFRYGTGRADGSSTFLERVEMLNTFPRVTLRRYRPKLEQLNHTEVSLGRRLGQTSCIEVAAYHDVVKNAAVWGSGRPGGVEWLAGSFLPNPAVDGITLNAGDYHSSGLRAAYSQKLGDHVEALIAYALGDALAAYGPASPGSQMELRNVLRTARSASLAGKVSARIPITHTHLTTSYEWGQPGRVTAVDPYGQADMQLQPFLGIQIRQPLPTLAFLPAHIEALADFRNLLAQGYVPLAQSGEKPLLLSPAYRSFRGGFSVQF